MDEVISSIPVSIDVGTGIEKGYLIFLYDRIEIKDIQGKIRYVVPQWNSDTCAVITEVKRKAFFFKSEQTIIVVNTREGNVRLLPNGQTKDEIEDYIFHSIELVRSYQERLKLEEERKRQKEEEARRREQLRLEEERKRQEEEEARRREQLRLEEERKRREEEEACRREQLRLEEERKRREEEEARRQEQLRLEEERKCQEEEEARRQEQLRLEEERKRQEEEEARRQEKLRLEEERKRREEEEARQQEKLRLEEERKRREEEEARRQEQLRLEEERKRREEEEARRQEQLRLEEERKRQEEEEARRQEQLRLEEERKRQEEEEARRQEQLRLEEERKRQEEEEARRQEQLRLEEERKRQEEEEARRQEQLRLEEEQNSHDDYQYVLYDELKEYCDQRTTGIYKEIFKDHILEFFEKYIQANENPQFGPECRWELDCLISVSEQFGLAKSTIADVLEVLGDGIDNMDYDIKNAKKWLMVLFDDLPIFGRVDFRIEEDNLCGGIDPLRIISKKLIDGSGFYSDLKEDHSSKISLIIQDIYREMNEKIIQDVHRYIKSQSRPISRLRLQQQFNTLSDIIIKSLSSRPDIIDYGGKYFSIDKIKASEIELSKWCDSISLWINSHEGICHNQFIYEKSLSNYRDLMSTCYIYDEKGLWGFLKCYLNGKYLFNDYYIANPDVRILSPEDRLRHFVIKHDEIRISSIEHYAKENYLKIPSMLRFISSLDDIMLMKNRETLCSIEKLKIDFVTVRKIENMISAELEEGPIFKTLRDLNCISGFPVKSYPWDEWLLYSALKKWGLTVHLFTTSPRLSLALPVVSLEEELSGEDLSALAKRYEGEIGQIMKRKIDDLTDLDDLISDEIDLDDLSFDDLELDGLDIIDDDEEEL